MSEWNANQQQEFAKAQFDAQMALLATIKAAAEQPNPTYYEGAHHLADALAALRRP